MPVKIIAKYNYYQGQLNRPSDGYIKDDDGRPKEFDTRKEAQAWIDDENDGVYHLANGEYASPDYIIEDDDYQKGEDCLPADGTETGFDAIDEKDVPEDVKKELLEANVDLYASRDGYDVYTETAERGDTQYCIVYCPTQIALDRHSDDLGGLDWDNYAFGVLR